MSIDNCLLGEVQHCHLGPARIGPARPRLARRRSTPPPQLPPVGELISSRPGVASQPAEPADVPQTGRPARPAPEQISPNLAAAMPWSPRRQRSVATYVIRPRYACVRRMAIAVAATGRIWVATSAPPSRQRGALPSAWLQHGNRIQEQRFDPLVPYLDLIVERADVSGHECLHTVTEGAPSPRVGPRRAATSWPQRGDSRRRAGARVR
jgi:hypothetical protein